MSTDVRGEEQERTEEKCTKTWIDVADDEHECRVSEEHDIHACHCGAANFDDLVEEPRSWSLPSEPGPEVMRLKDDAGATYVRGGTPYGASWWEPEVGANSLTRYQFHGLLRYVGRLTDATPPPGGEGK